MNIVCFGCGAVAEHPRQVSLGVTSPANGSELVKMATAGTQHLLRNSALRAVFLGLLSVLHPATCDEQVPLILWTSEG